MEGLENFSKLSINISYYCQTIIHSPQLKNVFLFVKVRPESPKNKEDKNSCWIQTRVETPPLPVPLILGTLVCKRKLACCLENQNTKVCNSSVWPSVEFFMKSIMQKYINKCLFKCLWDSSQVSIFTLFCFTLVSCAMFYLHILFSTNTTGDSLKQSPRYLSKSPPVETSPNIKHNSQCRSHLRPKHFFNPLSIHNHISPLFLVVFFF